MERKHTPGPWYVVDCRHQKQGQLKIKSARGQHIANVLRTGPNPQADASLIAAAPDLLEKLQRLVEDLDSLIASSDGVAGLHRNGDVAEWCELTSGGQFEKWLSSLDEARDLVDRVLQRNRYAPACR